MSHRVFTARLPALLAAALSLPACAQSHDDMHGMNVAPAPPVFVASSAKPFPALMANAMAVMDAGMARAPMDGNPDHDFVSMMLPHHQGAIDMARAVLLHAKDPELRNLALGIIVEQQNEINVMQAWLHHYPSKGERK